MKTHTITYGLTFMLMVIFCLSYCPGGRLGITRVHGSEIKHNKLNHWVLCIDSSQGMKESIFFDFTRMDLAKIGADIFIDLIDPMDHLSIISFAEHAQLEFQTSDPPGDEINLQKFEAQTAVNLLSPKGLAFLGEGLEETLTALEAKGNAYNETVLLLSSLWSSFGTQPESIAPQIFSRYSQIHPFGIGNRVNHRMLMDLATDSGGSYSYVWNQMFLPAQIAALYGEKNGCGELTKQFNIILSGETLFEKVMVDPHCEEVIFILYWMKKGSNLECLLVDPDGTRITPLSGMIPQPVYPYNEIHYLSRNLYKIYSVRYPNPGIWQMKIFSKDETGETPYVFDVIAKAPQGLPCKLVIETDQHTYSPLDLIQLEAFMHSQELIEGLKIQGTVNGTHYCPHFALYDDGLQEHNDQVSSDGIFSNIFNPCTSCTDQGFPCPITPGPYVFQLNAHNYDPLNLDEQNFLFPYPFQRQKDITILVDKDETDSPPVADAGLDLEVIHNDIKQIIPIQMNGLSSSDPEGDQIDFAWFASGITFDDPTSPTPTGLFPIGTTEVSLLVSDGANVSESDTVLISVKQVIKSQKSNSSFRSQLLPSYSLYNLPLFVNMPVYHNPLLSNPLSLTNYNYSMPYTNYSSLNNNAYSYLSPLFTSKNPYSLYNLVNGSYINYAYSYNFANTFSYRSANTSSSIIDSPYAINYVFGSGYTDVTINIINNYYYTYNYYE